MPLAAGSSKVFEFMQQDITIIPYDQDNSRVLLIVYDRTSISEARHKLEDKIRVISALNDELGRYLDVIDANINTLKTDRDGHIVSVSRCFCRLTGYSDHDLLNTNLRQSPIALDGEGLDELLIAVDHADAWEGEITYLDQDGQRRWLHTSLTPTCDTDDTLLEFTLIFHDITDQKVIEKLSVTDSLTGIYNRNKVDQALDYQLSFAERYQSPFSCILMDIDHFKAINDTYGHLYGDQVLRDMARLVSDNIRKTDIFARWGGEEFLLLLPHTELEQAGLVAEKLCTLIAAHPFSGVDNVTASFGVAQFFVGTSQQDLLSLCDDALYASKHGGRNRVTLASPSSPRVCG